MYKYRNIKVIKKRTIRTIRHTCEPHKTFVLNEVYSIIMYHNNLQLTTSNNFWRITFLNSKTCLK